MAFALFMLTLKNNNMKTENKVYKFTWVTKDQNRFDHYHIKYCKYPKKTKLYKELVNLLDKEKISSFKYYSI